MNTGLIAGSTKTTSTVLIAVCQRSERAQYDCWVSVDKEHMFDCYVNVDKEHKVDCCITFGKE